MIAPESLVSGPDLEQMLQVASLTPRGAFIEVGVYRGGSAFHLAELARTQCRMLYLADTFEGIPWCEPENGDSHKVGDFGDVNFRLVQDQFAEAGLEFWVEWVIGTFPKSWNRRPETTFAFAHIDCDQYRSVKESCQWLIPRMVPEGIIWFDDVDRLGGATKAAEELFGPRIRRHLSHAYVRIE